jgi:hypothetical protein
MPNNTLHHKEGATGVGVEVPLPKLNCGIKERTAIGYSGRVHKAVHAAKMVDSLIDQSATVICV